MKKKANYSSFNDIQLKDRHHWTNEALLEDVKYALQVGKTHCRWLPGGTASLKTRSSWKLGQG